jgi:hypothetical protein
VATATCIVIPRIGPLIVAAMTFFAVAAHFTRKLIGSGEARATISALVLRPEMLFIAWCFLACLWSTEPVVAFGKVVFLGLLIAHVLYFCDEAGQFEPRDIEMISQGVLAGFLLGGLYVCVEIFTTSALLRDFLTHMPGFDRGIGKHATIKNGVVVKLSVANISRVSVVYCLFLVPAALAAALYTRGVVKSICFALIAMSFVAVFGYSASQTAQLSLLIAAAAFLVAVVFPRVAHGMVAIAFVAALFLFVPLSIALFKSNQHMNPDVFGSAKARVIIWNFTSERILEKPIFGVGTNSTRYIDEKRIANKEAVRPPGFVVTPATRAHPHNIYLQIWYELGVIGVFAFGIFGLSLLKKIYDLPRSVWPFAIAYSALCIAVITPSYGMWQNWFQAVIAVSAMAFCAVSTKTQSSSGQLIDAAPRVDGPSVPA